MNSCSRFIDQRYNAEENDQPDNSARWLAIAGPYPRRFPPRREEGPPVNERVLRFREIRVVGADGSQLGVLTSKEALTLAKEAGLDLVMVAPQAQPPVCKIIDHGRYKYETRQRDKDSKKKTQDVKGIKMRPNIAENDMNTLLRHARKFLQEGDKVRVTCQFRARELAHPEIGKRKMERFAALLEEVAIIEKPPNLDGRLMIMVLNPKPGMKLVKKTHDENSEDGLHKDIEIEDHSGEDDDLEETPDLAVAEKEEATPAAPATQGKKGKVVERKKVDRYKEVDPLAELLGEA